MNLYHSACFYAFRIYPACLMLNLLLMRFLKSSTFRLQSDSVANQGELEELRRSNDRLEEKLKEYEINHNKLLKKKVST